MTPLSTIKFRVNTAPSSIVVPSSSRLIPSSSSDCVGLCMRRQILSEDDLANPPDKNVVDAVEGMGGNQLLASDVATKAGVSLSTAQKSLSALASLTRGDIAVTSSGDLLYTFPATSVKAALASNSLRYRIQSTWDRTIWPNLFWGIRVGFGVSIFVSLLAIFSTFLFLSASAGGGDGEDDRRDDRRRGGGGGMGMFNMFNMFYPRPLYFSSGRNYGYYGVNDPYNPTASRNRRTSAETDEDEEPNFFEKIFSYIFGDGNPNRGLEEARLRGAAEMIRSNGGSVVAEQLAPFCDVPDPDDMEGGMVDEGFVLPIVTQLGGEPVVTDEGDIVYLFEELQVSTGGDVDEEILRESLVRRRMEMMRNSGGEDEGSIGGKMEVLEEKQTEFSRTGTFGKVAAGGLGVVNLGGALYLGQVLTSPAMVGVQLPAIYGLIQSGYPLLLAYAVLYNAIPIFRYLYIQKANGEVDLRNSARRRWLTRVKEGGAKVGRKLKAAKSMRQKMRRLGGKEDMAYDTSADFGDVQKKKEMESLKNFDDLLKDDSESIFE